MRIHIYEYACVCLCIVYVFNRCDLNLFLFISKQASFVIVLEAKGKVYKALN